MIQSSQNMRITSPTGNNLRFKHFPKERAVLWEDSVAAKPNPHDLASQICFHPEYSSIHGRMYFDRSVSPPGDYLDATVVFSIEEGQIASVGRWKNAVVLRVWLKSFYNPSIFRMAHGCYGFLLGAKLRHNIIFCYGSIEKDTSNKGGRAWINRTFNWLLRPF